MWKLLDFPSSHFLHQSRPNGPYVNASRIDRQTDCERAVDAADCSTFCPYIKRQSLRNPQGSNPYSVRVFTVLYHSDNFWQTHDSLNATLMYWSQRYSGSKGLVSFMCSATGEWLLVAGRWWNSRPCWRWYGVSVRKDGSDYPQFSSFSLVVKLVKKVACLKLIFRVMWFSTNC